MRFFAYQFNKCLLLRHKTSLKLNQLNSFIMKKITLAIAALVIGLAMASCGGESPKESIMKAADEFFAQAETNVQAITSAEEFMNHFAEMEIKRDELSQQLFGPYSDKDGNITGISDSDMEEIQSYLYDRATAYNKVEAAKCAEFLTPAIEKYEQSVDALYEKFLADEQMDEETFHGLFEAVTEAAEEVYVFADYDNIPKELSNRYTEALGKFEQMFDEE